MANADQLPLPFPHAPHFAAADFLAAPSNAEALAWLSGEADWPQGRLALWGGTGRGKTHLLHVWAARSGGRIVTGRALPSGPPATALAVDDADAAPERALLHLMNAAAESGLPLLLAARTAPAHWRLTLPDLASRLRATVSAEIHPPEDELLRALLARLLAERQLAVPEAVQEWLLLRLPRDAASLREVAARLDHASLAAGGRVTRGLAASVLAALDETFADETLQRGEVTAAAEPASPVASRLL